MDDYQELIERLRKAIISPFDLRPVADAIESLLSESERLNHNLTSTEQTMRDYQELAAKRLEEIAKYRDAPVVAWKIAVNTPDGFLTIYYHSTNPITNYRQIDPNATVEPLIVKPRK